MSSLQQPVKPGNAAAGQQSICTRCKSAFSEEDNKAPAQNCSYHTGLMEPDYDSELWADHDEGAHGPIDSDEMREEFPEGFTWDCCGQSGDAKGCKRMCTGRNHR